MERIRIGLPASPLALYSLGNPTFRLANPLASLAFFACGPTFAGIIVSWATGGRAGLRSLWRRVVGWRISPWYYAVVLFSPALIMILGAFVRQQLGGVPLDFGQAAVRVQYPGLSPWAILPVALISGLLAGPLNEEIGWRGVALPLLQERFSPFVSTLVLGVVWGVWHIPLFAVGGMAQFGQPLLPFLVSVLLNSFFYTWLHNRTGGSVLLAILLHDTYNASTAYVPILPSEWVAIGATALVVGILVFGTRREWFGRSGRNQGHTPAAQASTSAD